MVEVVRRAVERKLGADLAELHHGLERRHPCWADRIEVVYISREGLRSFRTRRSPVSVVSPGEAFHTVEAGRKWVVNWFSVQEAGVALVGPPPALVLPTVGFPEVCDELRRQLQGWRSRIRQAGRPGGLAYGVLTVARSWDAATAGHTSSKAVAAERLASSIPRWAPLLTRALAVRLGHGGSLDPDEAATFVDEMAAAVAAAQPG